ncbi:MAG TPA: methyltransferase [Candidatus Acetothermia bacterium]|nr:methyltransferase [Candidatus Acetothermia bacterium]
MCELRNGDGVKPGLYTQIYDIVRQIQRGRVATYGQIAYVVGKPKFARQVGWALAALRDHDVDEPVPWQRVVNARGEVRMGQQQIDLLREEGIEFGEDGRIDLDLFGWDGLV